MNVNHPGLFNVTYHESIDGSLNLTFENRDENFLSIFYRWFVDGVLKLAGYGENVFNFIFQFTLENPSANVTMTKSMTINGSETCFQETANISTECGGLDNGSYVCVLTGLGDVGGPCENGFDADYDTRMSPGEFSAIFLYVNYSKPILSSSANVSHKWVNQLTPTTYNDAIPNLCFNQSILQLQIVIGRDLNYDSPANMNCWNGTSWDVVRDITLNGFTSVMGFYEEAIFWEIITFNDTVTEEIVINMNIIAPTIEVETPNGTLDSAFFIGNNETLNVTFTDEHLDSCWYNYNGTNVSIDGCVSGVKNSTQFILEDNNLNITLYSNDTTGALTIEFIEWEYLFKYWIINFTSPKYESTQGNFILNTSLKEGETIEEAIFEYNGTNYSTGIIVSNGNYFVTSSITLPSIDVDTNFTFSFFLVVDGITYNFLEETQEVLSVNFITCVAAEDLLINISLFDEEFKTNISGDIELNIQIYSKTSDNLVANLNNSFENIHSQEICLSPEESFPDLYLDAEIRYFKEGYTTEFYYIQKADLADYPINLSLFDLNQNDSTEFSVTYKNNAFIFVEGAIIQLQRKYIGEDIYEVVEAPITGDGGSSVLHIDLNTNRYRASVVKDGELLDFFENIVFNCDNELSGDCTHSLDGTVNPNNDIPIEDLTDFSYSISVNEDDQTITVLFAVPSGTPSTINVALNQIDTFGNLTACNTTVITSAGSITCGYTDSIESNILELSISKNGVQLAIANYANNPELDMDGINFFIMFLFMISLVGMAIASPEWMLIISVMVLMIGGTLLLVSGMNLVIGLGALAWLVVAIGIIIFKMAKQEDR